MNHFYTAGTLGDAYLAALKFYTSDEPITVHHITDQNYWENEIREIFLLVPPVQEVIFESQEKQDLPPRGNSDARSEGNPGGLGFEPYPDFNNILDSEIDEVLADRNAVLVVNSGKPHERGPGTNTKSLPKEWVKDLCTAFRDPIENRDNLDSLILLGTNREVIPDWLPGYVLDLVGETNLKQAMEIAYKADWFVGPEGLLSFVALSGKAPCEIYFTYKEAMRENILPCRAWRNLASLIEVERENGLVHHRST